MYVFMDVCTMYTCTCICLFVRMYVRMVVCCLFVSVYICVCV